ncbi:MAG: aminoglycoside phosphotransferase family protein [Planctomycetota bacterium]|nr:aminoglycoside phosphotransferase family protein [Planctomycetota bacterium]
MVVTDPQAPENAPLCAFVDSMVGPGWSAVDRSRRVGRKSIVWAVEGPGGERVYLKRHEERKLFERTRAAYERYIPALELPDDVEIPALLGIDETLGALVMTEIPGTVVAEGDLAPADLEAAYALAGRFVSRVHAVPLDADESSGWFAFWRQRLEQWLPLAEPAVDAETMAFTWAFATPDADEVEPPMVVTHGDCSPRNWIFRREAGRPVLGIIDWERAQPSMWIEDVWRMAYDFWHGRPELRAAWFRGYGREPSADEQRWLQRFSLAFGVGGIAWAVRQGDEDFVATNLKIIARVRADIG